MYPRREHNTKVSDNHIHNCNNDDAAAANDDDSDNDSTDEDNNEVDVESD